MTRTWEGIHITLPTASVVMWSLIFVPYNHGNGCAKSNAKFRARLDLDLVFLVPRRRERGLAWSSSRHLWLDVGLC